MQKKPTVSLKSPKIQFSATHLHNHSDLLLQNGLAHYRIDNRNNQANLNYASKRAIISTKTSVASDKVFQSV